MVAMSPVFYYFKLSIIHVCAGLHNFPFCIHRKRKSGRGGGVKLGVAVVWQLFIYITLNKVATGGL
jgi:hypothetical protein